MRIRFALLALALVTNLPAGAFAQPKKAGAVKEKSEPAAAKPSPVDPSADRAPSPSASASAPGSASASASASGGADDIGEAPPTARPATDPAKRPSPLTPAAAEFPARTAQPPPFEYDKLLADIAALRSRVSALTTTLFASKLRVVVETDGDEARLASFSVTLDGGVVFGAPPGFSAEDPRVVYEHAVAPGHHVLGVEVERYDARSKTYRTWQSSRFSLVVPESKLVDARLRLADDSDMAADFPDDQDGEYDLRVKLRARVAE